MDVDYPLSFAPDHRAPEHPAPDALVFAFHERKLLVTEMMEVPTFRQSVLSGCEFVRTQFLGQHGHTPCYSAQLDPRTAQAPGMLAMDLRSLYGKLNPEHHAIAGRGVQIAEWDRTHQFCGACGAATVLSSKDRSRSCPQCRIPMYPRLAPAMIVAVEKGNEILLARSAHFPPEIFSVLAGFIEPGESAEEAVIREVWEETRIVVENVRYFDSQPWPFPQLTNAGIYRRIQKRRDRHQSRRRGRGCRMVCSKRHAENVSRPDQYFAVVAPRLLGATRRLNLAPEDSTRGEFPIYIASRGTI